MKLSHLEPMAAKPSPPVDYATELKKYAEEKQGTPAVSSSAAETPTNEKEEAQKGFVRFVDFLSQYKKKPRKRSKKALALAAYQRVQEGPDEAEPNLDVRI